MAKTCDACREEVAEVLARCPWCGERLSSGSAKPGAPAYQGPLPWITASIAVLVFTGVVYVVLGFFLLPLMEATRPPGEEPMPRNVRMVMWVVMLGLSAGFGAFNFVAAYGLHKRTKWGWVMALICGGMYAPSACFPFGAVILYGLLKEDGRKAFWG